MNQVTNPSSSQTASRRWGYVAAGFVINLCLGSVYSWSVFRKPIEELFRVGATQSGLPYLLLLAVFALFMPITGSLLERYGPKAIGVVGGLIVGGGWMLSAFSSSIGVLSLTYGVITGIGVGVAYGGPITVATKWFPDRKGLAVGLTLAGFGLSAMITAPLMRRLIVLFGPLKTFGLLGVIFLILIVGCSLFLRFPARDRVGPGGELRPGKTGTAVDLAPRAMLTKPSFYGLWSCYVIGTLAGLMAIGIASPCGQEIVCLSPGAAASCISIFALFNGAGRPFFGWLTDRLTPQKAAIVSFVVIFAASAGMLNACPGRIGLYIVSFSLFWLALGGWLAIAPTAAAIFFGSRHYARNYGWVFTAYGVGAVAGTLMSGRLRDLLGSYRYAFYPTAVLALVGIVLAVILLKAPRRQDD